MNGSIAVTKKTPEEIGILREGGKILASVLKALRRRVKPGITLHELDAIARQILREKGAESSFMGYAPQTGLRPFPAVVCASVNWTVVHGIPRNTPLKQGDILSLDLGVRYKNLFTDAAITVGVGVLSNQSRRLISAARRALEIGISQARPGNYTGDIGYAISRAVGRTGFSVIRELVGHGVGYAVHEPPYVPNFGSPKTGIKLVPGMVIAIEPMITSGLGEVQMLADGSFVTKDQAPAAHFEHTVAITRRGPLVLTK
jgi:methionyl aminopeptidase